MLTGAVGAALVLSGVLSGCGSSGSDPATDEPTVVTLPQSGNSLLVAGPTSGEPLTERLIGKPVPVSGGCLGAQSGTKQFLVIWPHGTTVSTAEGESLQVDGEQLPPGGSFTGTGGWVTSKPFPAEFPDVPLKCLAPNQEKIMWLQEITQTEE